MEWIFEEIYQDNDILKETAIRHFLRMCKKSIPVRIKMELKVPVTSSAG